MDKDWTEAETIFVKSKGHIEARWDGLALANQSEIAVSFRSVQPGIERALPFASWANMLPHYDAPGQLQTHLKLQSFIQVNLSRIQKFRH